MRRERVLDPRLRLMRPDAWLAPARLLPEIEARLAPRATLRPRMVLSDENVLGPPEATLHPRLYPGAGARLRLLTPVLRPSGLWLSAGYATALKHTALRHDADAVRRRVLAHPPDWADLVARLRRAAPGGAGRADHRVGLRRIPRGRARSRRGADQRIGGAPARSARPAGHADAVRAAEALPRTMEREARRAETSRLYEAATGPRFTMFSPEEAARLGETPARQPDAIDRMDGVVLMRF